MKKLFFILSIVLLIIPSCKHNSYDETKLLGFWVNNSTRDELNPRKTDRFFVLDIKKDGSYDYGHVIVLEPKEIEIEEKGKWELTGDKLKFSGNDLFGPTSKEMTIKSLNDSVLVAVCKLDTLKYEKFGNDKPSTIKAVVHKMLDSKFGDMWGTEVIESMTNVLVN